MKINIFITLLLFVTTGCIHNRPPVGWPNEKSKELEKVCPDGQHYSLLDKKCTDDIQDTNPSVDPNDVAPFLNRAFVSLIKEEIPKMKIVLEVYSSTTELIDEIDDWDSYSSNKLVVFQLTRKYVRTVEKFNTLKSKIDINIGVNFTDNIKSGLIDLTEAAKIAGEKINGDFKGSIDQVKSILKASAELLPQQDPQS
ncbi:MAG: hypothetical protein HQK52_20530 [Oligoflexia bacterium]|nr:hypothetical protein [Oligoflexia bacterium]